MFDDKHLHSAKTEFLKKLEYSVLTMGTTDSNFSGNAVFVDTSNLFTDQESEILYADKYHSSLNDYYVSFHYFNNVRNLIELKSDDSSNLRKKELLENFSSNAESKVFYAKHLGFSLDDLQNVFEPMQHELELKCSLVYGAIENHLEDGDNPHLNKVSQSVNLKAVFDAYMDIEDISTIDALSNLEPVIKAHLEIVDNIAITHDSMDENGMADISTIVEEIKENTSIKIATAENETALSDTLLDDDNSLSELQSKRQ